MEAFEEPPPPLPPSSATPPALPLKLACGAGLSDGPPSWASAPRLILSAQAAHSCGLHPRHGTRRMFGQPRGPLPVQGPQAGEQREQAGLQLL